MNRHLLAYYIGITIVFGTHAYILINKDRPIPTVSHGSVNILACMLIAYYFMNKEGFIKF